VQIAKNILNFKAEKIVKKSSFKKSCSITTIFTSSSTTATHGVLFLNDV
jgi:hypothetical protein